MDVLNTYGGGVDVGALVYVIIVGLITLFFLIGAFVTRSLFYVLSTLVIGIIVIAVATTISEPVRHEITLRPDGVIDARKYEIIEQRGAIFVIEEREGTQ